MIKWCVGTLMLDQKEFKEKKKEIKRTLHNKFINENDRKTICVPNKTVVWYTKQIFRIVNYNKFVITEFELDILSNKHRTCRKSSVKLSDLKNSEQKNFHQTLLYMCIYTHM